MDWDEWMAKALPAMQGYIDEFCELERMAPAEDLEILEFFTEHERALLRFMQKEIDVAGAGAQRSGVELTAFLESDPRSFRAARAVVRRTPGVPG